MVMARLRGGWGGGPLAQMINASVPFIKEVSEGDTPRGAGGGFVSGPSRRVEASVGRVLEGGALQVG